MKLFRSLRLITRWFTLSAFPIINKLLKNPWSLLFCVNLLTAPFINISWTSSVTSRCCLFQKWYCNGFSVALETYKVVFCKHLLLMFWSYVSVPQFSVKILTFLPVVLLEFFLKTNLEVYELFNLTNSTNLCCYRSRH